MLKEHTGAHTHTHTMYFVPPQSPERFRTKEVLFIHDSLVGGSSVAVRTNAGH